jgi:hypothetical protein
MSILSLPLEAVEVCVFSSIQVGILTGCVLHESTMVMFQVSTSHSGDISNLNHVFVSTGFKSVITRYPHDKFGVAVFSNDELYGGIISDVVKLRIVDHLLGLEPIDFNARCGHLPLPPLLNNPDNVPSALSDEKPSSDPSTRTPSSTVDLTIPHLHLRNLLKIWQGSTGMRLMGR